MIIAGLQSLSTVDYPGHLASTVFVQGCNFRCPYCHNPELITLDKRFDFSEKDVFKFIDRRKKIIEAIVISGGEPTIYDDLPDFIKRLKDMNLKVKLDTNGSNPRQLEKLMRMWLLDYVALDIKTSLDKYHLVTNQKGIRRAVNESILLTMLSTVPYEFRTTCVPGIVGKEDFYSIKETARGAKAYYLQQFQGGVTYDKNYQNVKPYKKEDLEGFKKILEETAEKVEIRGFASQKEELRKAPRAFAHS